MSAYKNIAVAGAAGDLGSAVFKVLIDSNKFNLTVLTRAGSTSKFPSGIKVIQVDYESLDSLTSALQGQDAVVSTLGSLAIPSQSLLIDAAVAAGVKRFLPSEFGSNLVIPSVRKLPVFKTKVDIEDKLTALANEGKISYTFVYNSAFLDWGLNHGLFLDFKKAEATLWDGGNTEFSTTTLASVGQAVWTVKEAKIDDATAASDANIAKGIFDWPTLAAYLYRAIFDPSSVPKFPKLDNELLGVKGVTDEQVKELVKPFVQ
ncbi:hypothetical protein ACJA88_003699 [Fusarium oxysporum]